MANEIKYLSYSGLERYTKSLFEIIDENPRVKTASFETTENIDLTTGRVAVLITGDCNEFGGIILKKEYNSTSKLYKYQCQGFFPSALQQHGCRCRP